MGTWMSLASILGGALSFACTVGSLWADCWQVNSKGSVALSMRCRGLWGECVWDKFVKIWTCDVSSSYLNPHPAAILIARASVTASAIAGAGAFLCLLSGCQYFRCFWDSGAKRRCLACSVGLYLFAGLSCCVGVTRYSIYVFAQHQHEVSLKIPGFPSFEYGSSLWLAAAGTLVAFVTAVMSYWEIATLLKASGANPDKQPTSKDAGTAWTYV